MTKTLKIASIIFLLLFALPLGVSGLSMEPKIYYFEEIMSLSNFTHSFIFFLLTFISSSFIFHSIEKERNIKLTRKSRFLGAFFASLFFGLTIFSVTAILLGTKVVKALINLSDSFYYFPIELMVFLPVIFFILTFVVLRKLIIFATYPKARNYDVWRNFFYRTFFLCVKILFILVVFLLPTIIFGMIRTAPSYYSHTINYSIELIKGIGGFLILFLLALCFRFLLSRDYLEINKYRETI